MAELKVCQSELRKSLLAHQTALKHTADVEVAAEATWHEAYRKQAEEFEIRNAAELADLRLQYESDPRRIIELSMSRQHKPKRLLYRR